MSAPSELFPGFASHWIDTRAGRIFARSHGSGPPLLLLHGFPQTHVMWHRVAPALAEKFSVVLMDLRGYGWSDAPRSSRSATPKAPLWRLPLMKKVGVDETLNFSAAMSRVLLTLS